MTNKIYLHVGAHKTGTTTLQAELALNRAELKANGLIYPDFNGADSHFQWARFLAGEMPKLNAEKHAQVTADWLNSLQPDQALLLSAESFYRHITTQPDYLEKLKLVFQGVQITPVLCLRSQADFARSLYGEWVLNWQYPHDIYRFIKEFYHWFDFESVVKQLSLLGRPHLISYHQIAGNDLSSNFLKQLGYNATLTGTGNRLRTSLSDAEIYLKQLLNAEYPHLKYRAIITDVVKQYVSVKYPELKAPMPTLIWHGLLDPATFERSFKMSNIRLSQEYSFDLPAFFAMAQPVGLPQVDTKILSLLVQVLAEIKLEIRMGLCSGRLVQ